MDDGLPLYVVGIPDDEFYSELIISKFSSAIKRLKRVFGKIDEARISIKVTRTSGKRKHYVVSVLIKTNTKRLNYKDDGWDLSNVCEKLNQKILGNLTKRPKKRTKASIRKIAQKLF